MRIQAWLLDNVDQCSPSSLWVLAYLLLDCKITCDLVRYRLCGSNLKDHVDRSACTTRTMMLLRRPRLIWRVNYDFPLDSTR